MRAANESDSIDIHRFPVETVNEELEALLIMSGKHHDCSTVLHEFTHSVPHEFSNPPVENPNKDARANLQQPSREMAPQSGRTGSNDKDYHGTSNSSAP